KFALANGLSGCFCWLSPLLSKNSKRSTITSYEVRLFPCLSVKLFVCNFPTTKILLPLLVYCIRVSAVLLKAVNGIQSVSYSPVCLFLKSRLTASERSEERRVGKECRIVWSRGS